MLSSDKWSSWRDPTFELPDWNLKMGTIAQNYFEMHP